jgi:2-iminobutanoate/2-iminopropanoate deaminase
MVEGKAKRILGTEKVAGTDGTWAQCTRKGNLLFISGQVSLDAGGNLVGKDDFEAQAKQTLKNLEAMLEAAGAGMQDLMMITFFRSNPPASTLV